MQAELQSVNRAVELLTAALASAPDAVVHRGVIHPVTEADRPVFVSASLRKLSPAEDANAASASLKEVMLSLSVQSRENDRDEAQLYADYFAPAVAALEREGWVFDESLCVVVEIGKVVFQTITAELTRVP